jgi:hypothetical protein
MLPLTALVTAPDGALAVRAQRGILLRRLRRLARVRAGTHNYAFEAWLETGARPFGTGGAGGTGGTGGTEASSVSYRGAGVRARVASVADGRLPTADDLSGSWWQCVGCFSDWTPVVPRGRQQPPRSAVPVGWWELDELYARFPEVRG